MLFNKANILINGVGCTFVPISTVLFHIGRKHRNTAAFSIKVPGTSNSQMSMQSQRLVLSQNTDRFNPRVRAIAKSEVNNSVFPAKVNGRLRQMMSQRSQSSSFS